MGKFNIVMRRIVYCTKSGVWLVKSLVLLGLFVSNTWAEPPGTEIHDCRSIISETERLYCYDSLPLSDETQLPPAADEMESDARPALEQRLEKESDLARRAFAIIPHRPNYLLYTYNSEPNVAPFLAVDPETDLEHQELKFQISLRVPLYNRMFGENGDLWFAYTQLSFWQAFNWAQSAPFRETDYEPELGLTFHTDFSLLGLKHRLFAVGFAHQSNGRGEPLSRSWNRLWASFQLERGNFVLAFKPWYRIPTNSADDNNPDILDYAGRAELRSTYKYGEQVLSFTLRNNLRSDDNRSGYELDWSFPFSKRIKGLVQFYNGYGESLIDYNVWTRRAGVGVLVEDWL
jgi:phospholipase A1